MPNNAKINIVGNLIRDPELKDINGTKLWAFTVAVNTLSKKPDGTYDSNFYDCSWFGDKYPAKFAEACQKGTTVFVTGDFYQSEYKKNDGTMGYRLKINVTSAVAVARMKDRNATEAPKTDDIGF